MKTTLGESSQIACPECDIGPFQRNHYFTGKLLVERDFTDEQRYVIDKLRLHHQGLHGTGVVCGLKITPHQNEDCRDRYVCIEPGSAVDCCGREILLLERECIDLSRLEAVQALTAAAEAENGDAEPHTLQICIRYRECPTEEIPVLYDECGCNSTQCAPNRILESWQIEVLVDPDPHTPATLEEPCCDHLWDSLAGCPSCEQGDCIVLATIEGYRPGFRFEAMPEEEPDPAADEENGIARLDNHTHRPLLPSTQALAEIVKCLCAREAGEGNGTPGEPGPGIDRVEVSFVACDQAGSAAIREVAGERVLVLEIPGVAMGRTVRMARTD